MKMKTHEEIMKENAENEKNEKIKNDRNEKMKETLRNLRRFPGFLSSYAKSSTIFRGLPL